MTNVHRLNLGCGADIKEGYVNVDIVKLPGVQVVDLDNPPYPFASNLFDEVLADNVIEHLNDTVCVMRELHRILKPGGVLIIKVPHYLSHDAWSHPQHRRAFAIDSFDFFVQGTKRHNADGRCFNFQFTHITRKIVFEKGKNPLNFLNYFIEPLVNLAPKFYERSPLHIFLPSSIEARMLK